MVQSLKHVLHLKSTSMLHKENSNKVQLMPNGIFQISLAGSGFSVLRLPVLWSYIH